MTDCVGLVIIVKVEASHDLGASSSCAKSLGLLEVLRVSRTLGDQFNPMDVMKKIDMSVQSSKNLVVALAPSLSLYSELSIELIPDMTVDYKSSASGAY